ncbi:MAG: hypothetical protein KJ072_26635 [Verrucomicrobia bacterium]|nr:hypothetical protein [Verrucomicrobiota bacterium]
MNFDDFFQAATGHRPYDCQRRLACGAQQDRPEADWLSQPDPDGCRSRRIHILTGLGRTAASLAEVIGQSIACHSATAA